MNFVPNGTTDNVRRITCSEAGQRQPRAENANRVWGRIQTSDSGFESESATSIGVTCAGALGGWHDPQSSGTNRHCTMRFTTIAGQSLAVEAVPLLEPERKIVRESLSRRNAGRAHLAIVDAYGRLERRIQTAIESSGMIPACRPGCGWCCHGVKVNVTALEALAVAEHLKRDDTSLRKAVQAAAVRRRTMNTDQLFASKDPCPFLDSSNRCQIYEVRPSACRRHCCMDETECERALSNPELKLTVTQHAPANVAGALSALAWAAAMEDAQLDYRTFELTSAVAVALQPGAAEKWARGERVFDAAVRAVDEKDQATIRAELGGDSDRDKNVARPTNTWKRHSKKRQPSRS